MFPSAAERRRFVTKKIEKTRHGANPTMIAPKKPEFHRPF